MSLSDRLERLIQGAHMTQGEAQDLMVELVGGQANASQVAGILIALRSKGVTAEELAGFASALRASAVRLAHSCRPLVDTCGTGGGKPTFNISTAAAILAAACGAKVGKHGNRAVSSRCGSADVLEAAGVCLHTDPERLVLLLETVGIVFMFAPAHHPAMKHVGGIRKDLGVRTVFNQLGPLANPADADVQLIGVFSPDLLEPIANAVRLLGMRRALLVHGDDSMDEISPCGPTTALLLDGGAITKRQLNPADFGMDPCPMSAIEAGNDPAENAAIMREAIGDWKSPRSAAIWPSAAAAVWLAGLAPTLAEAKEQVVECVRSGAGYQKLEQLVEASNL